MADGTITIDTEIDESGLDAGLNSVQQKLDNASSQVTQNEQAVKQAGKAADAAGKSAQKAGAAVDKAGKQTKQATASVKGGKSAVDGLKTVFAETCPNAQGLIDKFQGIASSGGVMAAGIVAGVMAAKKLIDVMGEGTAAFKVQENAEKGLALAARNNPYLNGDAVARLKQYASEVQGISNYGDEGTIDIMARLASTGRGEADIMKIIGAAADYAAATHMDLASAATQLNATYSGNIGMMGRQIAELKDLTAEQLRNGDAIDIIASKYKGFASEVVDKSTQAKNAFGDFMESIGQIAKPTFDLLADLSTNFWGKMTEGMNGLYNGLGDFADWITAHFTSTLKNSIKTVLTEYKLSAEQAKKLGLEEGDIVGGAKGMSTEGLEWVKKQLEGKKKLKDEEQMTLVLINEELALRKRQADWEEREAAKEADRKKKAEEDAAKEAARKANTPKAKTAGDYLGEYNKTVDTQDEKVRLTRQTGQDVSAEKEAQDRLNTMVSAYIKMRTEAGALLKDEDAAVVKIVNDIKAQTAEAAKYKTQVSEGAKENIALTEALAAAMKGMLGKPINDDYKTLSETLEDIITQVNAITEEEVLAAQAGAEQVLSKREVLDTLTQMQEAAALVAQIDEDTADVTAESEGDRYKAKIARLEDERSAIERLSRDRVVSEEDAAQRIDAIDEELAKTRRERAAETAETINGYVQKSASAMQSACNLMLDAVKTESDLELAELKEKHEKGEMSDEEYEKKSYDIKKKGAQNEYKVKMAQWAMGILTSQAEIAAGMVKTIGNLGFPEAIPFIALAGAAGSIQLAAQIAAKPVPPSFATGGFVGGMNGASMGGDNTLAHLRTGEMVANAAQQRNLWDAMNGNSPAANATNITVNNSAANIVTAQPRIDKGKIEIMIDARVNDSMRSGRYTSAMGIAQSESTGAFYGV